MSFTTVSVSPSATAMPADSWPAVLQGVEAEVGEVGDRLPGRTPRRRHRPPGPLSLTEASLARPTHAPVRQQPIPGASARRVRDR